VSGKVVVVTGATRGIGAGLARELVGRGCSVVVCGRHSDAVRAAVATLGVERATGIAADITSRDDLQRLWDHGVDRFGHIDVWINNAGVSARRVPFEQLAPQELATVVETNLIGAMNGTHVAVNGFLAQAQGPVGLGGQVWCMEGFGSDGRTADGIATYGATKRAVSYFVKGLGKELRGAGPLPVQVHWLSPGIVATDLLVDDYDGDPAAFEKARKIFNILGDRVETVTPWLAERVLATDSAKPRRVAWLTTGKAARRFATAGFRKRDIFADTELGLPAPRAGDEPKREAAAR
jgi:NAD(P)-dependent dehydrogenase (short-subunit alcohol dehydrogenase family)